MQFLSSTPTFLVGTPGTVRDLVAAVTIAHRLGLLEPVNPPATGLSA
jgi:hypothetical protein